MAFKYLLAILINFTLGYWAKSSPFQAQIKTAYTRKERAESQHRLPNLYYFRRWHIAAKNFNHFGPILRL